MLIGFLTTLFVILCLFLALFILLQQGKGDMGLGSLGGSAQMLFGGSGGQEFFVRTTWILGFFFLFGSLGLAILKSRQTAKSHLEGFKIAKKTTPQQAAASEAQEDVARALDEEGVPAEHSH